VNGWWLRTAGAGRQCAPAALIGASGRPLNFTVRRRVSAQSLASTHPQASTPRSAPFVTRNVMGYTEGNDQVVPSQGIG
jgi:hypothetical protein